MTDKHSSLGTTLKPDLDSCSSGVSVSDGSLNEARGLPVLAANNYAEGCYQIQVYHEKSGSDLFNTIEVGVESDRRDADVPAMPAHFEEAPSEQSVDPRVSVTVSLSPQFDPETSEYSNNPLAMEDVNLTDKDISESKLVMRLRRALTRQYMNPWGMYESPAAEVSVKSEFSNIKLRHVKTRSGILSPSEEDDKNKDGVDDDPESEEDPKSFAEGALFEASTYEKRLIQSNSVPLAAYIRSDSDVSVAGDSIAQERLKAEGLFQPLFGAIRAFFKSTEKDPAEAPVDVEAGEKIHFPERSEFNLKPPLKSEINVPTPSSPIIFSNASPVTHLPPAPQGPEPAPPELPQVQVRQE